MDRLHCYIAASSTDVIGPARYRKILDKWGDIRPFFDLSLRDQLDFFRLSGPKYEKPLSQMMKRADKIRTQCEKKDIRMISREDAAYPPLLKVIPDPPVMIYMRGIYNHSIPKLGVVGTRKASPEGESINTYFCREMVSYQVGIVSGLAHGHDAIAARSTLENDGYTVAVLGGSIDVAYPAANTRLYDEIRDKGCIISEYPPGTAGHPWRFPLRNRIISGLSQAVLIVQAPARSGALITAKYAEAQGRCVFAVPGNPMDERNSGNNRLIQNGARIALSAEDILQEIFHHMPVAKPESKHWKERADLEPREIKLMEHMSSEVYIDDLANLSGLSISSLNSLLTGMELKGLIKQYPGRYYLRNV